MKKLAILLVTVSMLLVTFAGCAMAAPSPLGPTAAKAPVIEGLVPGCKVGFSLSDQSQQKWVLDANTMKEAVEKLGYTLDIQWADVKPALQIQQIENMILTGCKAIVVLPVDAGSLGEVLKKAKEAGVLIINYDLMVLNTPDVDYYIGFDNKYITGRLQAEFIVDRLGLKNGAGPFNMEIFTGSLDEVNSYWYYDRQMEVLKPYFDSGQLVVKSGQTAIEVCTILGWQGAVAAARMENLITSNYADGTPLHAVLCPSDAISVPVGNTLKNAGYGTPDKPMPIITGNNGLPSAIQSMLAGEQTMSIFKDTRVLAQKTAELIDAVAKGEAPKPNDLETFDNGAIIIPAFVYGMEVIDINNWKKVTVDSGYYTLDQITN